MDLQKSPPIQVNQATQQQQATDSHPFFRPLRRGADAIDACIAKDAKYPELGDIVGQGQSSDYSIEISEAWVPYERRELVNIPDAIFEQYNRTECYTQMDLFAEIQRAWITVDNRLYLWNFMNGSADFASYEDNPHTITCVKLVKPRPGVFHDMIAHLLVVATPNDIFILGVKIQGEITFYNTRMSVPVGGIDVSTIESTLDGRIFFAGKDNHLYELTYQTEDGWFSKRCSKINHTGSSLGNLVPQIFATESKEHVTQIVVDNTRNLVYTLSSKSTIRTFHLIPPNSLPAIITYTYNSLVSHSQMINASSSLLDPRSTSIISLTSVTLTESPQLNLIATTSTGCRLYLRAVRSSSFVLYNDSNSPPTSMQVTHVRFPPKLQDGKTHNLTKKADLFPPGLFISVVNNSSNGQSVDGLFLSAPETGRIANTSGRPQFWESAMWLPLDGFVQAISLTQPGFLRTSVPDTWKNELISEFDTPPTEIAVLTNTGVYIIRRRRAVDIFSKALLSEVDIRKFYETHGRVELCVSALGVICSSNDRLDLVDLSRRLLFEYGGKPFIEGQLNTSHLENFKPSSRTEALAVYISRLIRCIWTVPILTPKMGPKGPEYVTLGPHTLQKVQSDIVRLYEFLKENRSFLDGLGSETHSLSFRPEEVAVQQEHQSIHSLYMLLEQIVEGISFVLVLGEHRASNVIGDLPQNMRDEVMKLNHRDLFTTDRGRDLAKEIVSLIVNRQIAEGESIEIVASALRSRCGSFCSADDVVLYKAVEQLRGAKSTLEEDERMNKLQIALNMFLQTCSTLTLENLAEAVGEFKNQNFHVGAVRLALEVAKASNRQLQMMLYNRDMKKDNAEQILEKRDKCYRLVFEVVEHVETLDNQDSSSVLREQTFEVLSSSEDEHFQFAWYDWLFERGQLERRLETPTQHLQSYLEQNATSSLDHANLLWQYFGKIESVYEAAKVLHSLAQCDFPIILEQRIEYLSRAKGFCNCFVPPGGRQQLSALGQEIQEELDVASIQDDILRRIGEDERLTPEKRAQMASQLDGKLLVLTDLFNQFADPLGYAEICLEIYETANYRDPREILKCWEKILQREHENYHDGAGHPYEAIADTFRRLGQKFLRSDVIFQPEELLPLLEKYFIEEQKDVSPPGWVPDVFLDAGVSHELVFSTLDELWERQEPPFQGKLALLLLARDILHTAEKWLTASMRPGIGRADRPVFRNDIVLETLKRYSAMFTQHSGSARDLKVRIEKLAGIIRKNFL
ncbi:putative nucleoporin [Neolecta irregularis DAH-3]|uniref:Putative nucleoporin n=1 Tax=Neolecta irregularis (strain DAH-3) TaxID=1198029 RepID=A0A1U7LGP1_NEOID|nr:putative nucleoporin [Neolecta irregularis DAH-3]|eukprot:OLL21763.1 putative nucleoporin [Neolecta irregularis DAH-3]